MNITVTKPFMPPLQEVVALLEGVWRREWLTNHGPLASELELRLKEYLAVDHLLFTTNGTISLQIAINALGGQGEILTTPFSYVATTSSIVWQKCTPVMVDVDEGTFNLDPRNIERSITDRTTAILATHVFGNPCDVDGIGEIAKRHGLPVIYDAAHAFGTRLRGRSLAAYGDVSVCSFHATKPFHTVEGGALVSPNPETLRQMALMRNFGHTSTNEFETVGINGKNSELHAAVGLVNLGHLDGVMARRKHACHLYTDLLSNSGLQFQKLAVNTDYNYAYFPVLFEDEAQLLNTVALLNTNSVFPRRYFYPALTELPYIKGQNAPIAESISRRILCLPLYDTLSDEEVRLVARLVKRSLRYKTQ